MNLLTEANMRLHHCLGQPLIKDQEVDQVMAPSLPVKKYLHEEHPDLRPTVFQQEASSLQQLIY